MHDQAETLHLFMPGCVTSKIWYTHVHVLKTLNKLLFNENDKQFQCRCALLHNHTTFMCKSNHTNECNTITSEIVSMITTLSDLFPLNIK